MHICVHCKKECKNENSLRNHQRLCKLNPNRQSTPFHDLQFQKTCKKGNQYTKAKENGVELSISDSTREKIRASAISIWTEEKRKDWSERMKIQAQKNLINHPESYSSNNICGRSKKTMYNGVWMHSSWELLFAKWLDSNNISWNRKIAPFSYEWKGSIRKYFPDFYISVLDVYVEVKGYQTERDIAKWSAVPNLIAITEKDIRSIKKGTYSVSDFYGKVSQVEESIPHKDECAVSITALTTNFKE